MTTPFNGVIGRTIDESQPAWPEAQYARSNAPNVVIIMLDDTGFAQLGCYGAPIRTPTLDALAAGGLRYNNFHTTALCSPTRACVLTGRNHHSCGMGCITEGATGYPGYNGQIPFENGFLSEMLLEHGYNTYAVGKWHLTPAHEISAAGPYTRWPLGRGFERFYGFMGGLGCMLACGENPGSPVTSAYKDKPPFHFTGTLHHVTIDVSGELLRDKEAEMRMIMARQ